MTVTPPPPWERVKEFDECRERFVSGLRDFDSAWQEMAGGAVRRFVAVRSFDTSWGSMVHLMIFSPLDKREPPWPEKQRIKDAFAPGRVAVEVFPRVDAVVDDDECWHLWVLPVGFDLPFTLEAL